MFRLFVKLVLFSATLSVEGYVGLTNSEKVPCLECICEATTGCNDIFVCAEKNINVEYWSFAGENIAGGEKNRKSESNSNYRDCMQDRICILNTIYHYTDKVIKKLQKDSSSLYCQMTSQCSTYIFQSKLFETCHFHFTFNFDHQISNEKDINCDGIISCADLFAAHKFGLNAKKSGSTFSIGVSKRFDRCEDHGIINVTNNWHPGRCEESIEI